MKLLLLCLALITATPSHAEEPVEFTEALKVLSSVAACDGSTPDARFDRKAVADAFAVPFAFAVPLALAVAFAPACAHPLASAARRSAVAVLAPGRGSPLP